MGDLQLECTSPSHPASAADVQNRKPSYPVLLDRAFLERRLCPPDGFAAVCPPRWVRRLGQIKKSERLRLTRRYPRWKRSIRNCRFGSLSALPLNRPPSAAAHPQPADA